MGTIKGIFEPFARYVRNQLNIRKEILSNSLMKPAGWHLMGTARMGNDPETSVVDKNGRAHDIQNLYIIDGSILVTGGAVNPTSTIQAIALYIADKFENCVK